MLLSRCCKSPIFTYSTTEGTSFYICEKCDLPCDFAIITWSEIAIKSLSKERLTMSPEMLSKLRQSLVNHEGFSTHLYQDTVGKWTIGIGYNISDRGLDEQWISEQFLKDVNFFYEKLSSFSWFPHLNFDRQIALIDMAFMGWKKFLSFKKMICALEKLDFYAAAAEMLDSKWADQVKGRSQTLANAILTGTYNT